MPACLVWCVTYTHDLQLHYGLIEAIIEQICNHEPPGGVLVFLTSWEDIQTMTELLSSNSVVGNPALVKLLPLHSTLQSVSQEEIFKTPDPGIRCPCHHASAVCY